MEHLDSRRVTESSLLNRLACRDGDRVRQYCHRHQVCQSARYLWLPKAVAYSELHNCWRRIRRLAYEARSGQNNGPRVPAEAESFIEKSRQAVWPEDAQLLSEAPVVAHPSELQLERPGREAARDRLLRRLHSDPRA